MIFWEKNAFTEGKPIAEGSLNRIEEDENIEEEKQVVEVKKLKEPPKIVHPPLKVGTKLKVRFYNTSQGAKPYTKDAEKRKVGKNKEWYEGEVKKIDKDTHEYSIYFPSDKETVVLTPPAPKTHYIPHTSLRQSKVGKIRGFVDTALLAHKPLP